jgi:predicted metal-dependent hydrolase
MVAVPEDDTRPKPVKIPLKSAPPPVIPPIPLPDGRELRIEIRRSERARRVALRILMASASLELVVPRRVALRSALAFLESKRGWIIQRALALPRSIPFVDGAVIPVLGMPHRLAWIGPEPGARASFAIMEGRIEVAGRPEHLARRTRDGLAAHARRLLTEKSLDLARRIGRPLAAVRIGDARSRWGSCAAGGRLRYSWRLVLAPERVMDYVVAHEVAHLAEMNHSPRFWRLVADLHVGWEDDRRWLRRNGPQLLLYG